VPVLLVEKNLRNLANDRVWPSNHVPMLRIHNPRQFSKSVIQSM